MLRIVLISVCLLQAGCAGRLVCEWETQDERFEKLITETIDGLQKEDETVQKP